MKNRILLISLAVVLALSIGLIGCGGEEVPEYSLIISSTEGGEVTSPGEGTFTYDEGEVVNLVAEAAEGYQFVNWTGDADDIGDVEDAATTIAMNGNYTITASFEAIPPTQYNLTTSSTEGGEVTVPGEGTHAYAAGTVVNLVAEAEDGYQFVEWIGDIGSITDVDAAVTTITMNDNYSITANFEEIPPGQFALTISSNTGGSVTVPGEGSFLYDDGMVVSLVATPLSGYHFVNWSGDVSTVADVGAASTTITMNDDYSIVGNFDQIPVTYYTLTLGTNGNGSTNPSIGQHTYIAGTVVSITATPANCCSFVNWTGDVSTVGNVNAPSTTITMNDAYSIMANFEVIPPVQYSLNISSNTGGSVITPGEGSFMFDDGTVVSLVATPLSGCYQFANWTGNVGTIANVNAASTTITMNDNYSITAYFPGVVDLANTELYQAGTAIICCMADGQTGVLTAPSANTTACWEGEEQVIWVEEGTAGGWDAADYDAADYIYGPFRATYTVNGYGEIIHGSCCAVGQWGCCITWDPEYMCWIETP